MVDLSKKIIYASSLALLAFIGAGKAYAADADYSVIKPHSMLTTAYASAWNDVNKASDAKGTGDGKAAKEAAKEEKEAEKANDKADKKAEEAAKDENGVKGKVAPKPGANKEDADKAAKKADKKKAAERKAQLKAQEKAEKQIAEIQKRNNANNYYGNGGKAAHGNGGQ